MAKAHAKRNTAKKRANETVPISLSEGSRLFVVLLFNLMQNTDWVGARNIASIKENLALEEIDGRAFRDASGDVKNFDITRFELQWLLDNLNKLADSERLPTGAVDHALDLLDSIESALSGMTLEESLEYESSSKG